MRQSHAVGRRHTTECYAHRVGGCEGKMSREHPLSDSVLRQIGDTISIQGFPWLGQGERKNLPVSALAARMLCKGHNSKLSPLDSRVLGSSRRWRSRVRHSARLSIRKQPFKVSSSSGGFSSA